jgi:hypothetical protein
MVIYWFIYYNYFLILWFCFSLAKELNDKNSKIHFYLGDSEHED